MFVADCLSEKVKNTKYKIVCFFTEVVKIYIKRFDLLRFVWKPDKFGPLSQIKKSLNIYLHYTTYHTYVKKVSSNKSKIWFR